MMAQAATSPGCDWSLATSPQTHAADRVIPAYRGKMLGGSSGTNYMAWDWASKPEYDAWKVVSQEAGQVDAKESTWDYEGLLPYLQKAEGEFSENDPFVKHQPGEAPFVSFISSRSPLTGAHVCHRSKKMASWMSKTTLPGV
jgi:choline dehydrogenase-like flavoprotein